MKGTEVSFFSKCKREVSTQSCTWLSFVKPLLSRSARVRYEARLRYAQSINSTSAVQKLRTTSTKRNHESSTLMHIPSPSTPMYKTSGHIVPWCRAPWVEMEVNEYLYRRDMAFKVGKTTVRCSPCHPRPDQGQFQGKCLLRPYHCLHIQSLHARSIGSCSRQSRRG